MSEASAPADPSTRGRRLARNAAWSLVAQIAPLVVAFVCIPILIRGLGTERYGTLTLLWVTLAYFTILDLGLSRALMQAVAERVSKPDQAGDLPELVWTTLLALAALSAAAAVTVVIAAPPIVHHLLNVPPPLRAEATSALRILAIAFPLVTIGGAASGVLQASHRFGLITAISLPAATLNYLAPLAVIPFTTNLAALSTTTVLVRAASCVAFLLAALAAVPALRRRIAVRPACLPPLLRFGGWLTFSTIAAVFLVNVDRIVIAATISVAATAYYATPYDMVTKIGFVPQALMGVLFPAFAAVHRDDPARARLLFARGTTYVLLAVLPICLGVFAFSHEILRWWVGPTFAEHGSGVLRWLAAGILVNSLAHVPFAMLQAAGRADLPAKAHAIEVPIYLACLWTLTSARGIEGAAIAWAVRVALDTILLYAFAIRLLPDLARDLRRPLAGALCGLAAIAVPLLLPDPWHRGAFLAAAVPLSLAAGWWLLLSDDERRFFRGYLSSS